MFVITRDVAVMKNAAAATLPREVFNQGGISLERQPNKSPTEPRPWRPMPAADQLEPGRGAAGMHSCRRRFQLAAAPLLWSTWSAAVPLFRLKKGTKNELFEETVCLNILT